MKGVLLLLDNPDEITRSRFTNMKCVSKNKTIMDFRYCRVKVFSRNSSALAINLTLYKRLMPKITVKSCMSYKYGTIYRKVVDVPEFELCSVMRNVKLLPKFIKAIFDIFGDTVKRLFEGCPYFGDFDFLAQIDDTQWPSIFPSGFYRIDFNFKANQTPATFLNFEFEMISSIKSSF
jgi:hypothetical protein